MKQENKVVWVVGASSGIGEQLCYELDRKGAKLIITSRSPEKLNAVNAKLPVNPGSAKILAADLAEHDKLPSVVNKALSFYGGIDVLFCNAGIAVRDWVMETTGKVDKWIMDVNYFGPVIITKCLLPHFIEKGSGQVVVTSSLSGKYGVPKTGSYAASKHALQGFFETLRSETFDKGIKITIVIPGMIQTRITEHALTGKGESYGRIEKSFEKAYPAEKAAAKIVAAAERNKEEVFVGGSEGITLILNRISPYLLRRFIRNHPIKKLRKLKSLFGFK